MSSNFFAQQDLARRNTRILVALFTLAVLLLLLLTNIVTLISLGLLDPAFISGPWQWQTLPWHLLGWVSLGVIAAVALAVLYKWQQLKAGGKVVAQSLGGVRLSADSSDPLQRRLLNVVEEMALAANTPVPPVYLLPEHSINAFAAGYGPADAVIGVRSLWADDPLYPIARRSNIRIVEVDAARPVDGALPGVALQPGTSDGLNSQPWMATNNMGRMADVRAADLVRLAPSAKPAIEANLAHAVKDANGRSYNRTKYLAKRFDQIQQWADYLDRLRKGAGVIPMKQRAA